MRSQLQQWLDEVQLHAANPEHEWDRRALDWPHINADSVVFEVGAFKGRWALQMAGRYNPRLYAFEPQTWAAAVATAALRGTNAQVFAYGPGVIDGRFPMLAYGSDGGTFAPPDAMGDVYAWGELREMSRVLTTLDIDHIDLVLMNIEGYEHQLIPHMLQHSILPAVLMVQMHGDELACEDLRQTLRGHYRLLWDYGRALSAWEVR